MTKQTNNKMHILLVFFSATGNTKKISNVVKERLIELNIKVTIIDITSSINREKKLYLDNYDAIFFGFPIYSMRAPRICREWLKTLDGKQCKCSVFFTYGGFGKDPAHYYMKELLDNQKFTLVSTAEFLASHTFNHSGWKAALNRPNESDFLVVKEYVNKTIDRFLKKDKKQLENFSNPKYSKDELNQAEKYRYKLISKLPTRGTNICSLCGLCEKLCPVNAMNMKDGIANDNCIACFRCISNCPEKALHTNDISDSWTKKLDMHNMTENKFDSLKSKIYL